MHQHSNKSSHYFHLYECRGSDKVTRFHPHLITTLSKWSARIQAVTPSNLLPSNRNAFNRKNEWSKSAVELIDGSLLDRAQLLSRTHKWRGKGVRLGKQASDIDGETEHDVNVFDDLDFYQQLLRDVIESQDGGNDDWMVLQKQKKANKKVDTKASKGRRMRSVNEGRVSRVSLTGCFQV
jgi:protein AATF/BFR2